MIYVVVCRALIGSLFTAETVRVFKISKKADGTSTNFQAVFDFEKVTQDYI